MSRIARSTSSIGSGGQTVSLQVLPEFRNAFIRPRLPASVHLCQAYQTCPSRTAPGSWSRNLAQYIFHQSEVVSALLKSCSRRSSTQLLLHLRSRSKLGSRRPKLWRFLALDSDLCTPQVSRRGAVPPSLCLDELGWKGPSVLRAL